MKKSRLPARLVRYQFLPSAIENLNKKQQKAVVKLLDGCQIQFLTEFLLNLQRKTFSIPQESVKKLKKYSSAIKVITSPGSNLRKRKISFQRGGFLSILIPIISAALPLILDAIKSNNG